MNRYMHPGRHHSQTGTASIVRNVRVIVTGEPLVHKCFFAQEVRQADLQFADREEGGIQSGGPGGVTLLPWIAMPPS